MSDELLTVLCINVAGPTALVWEEVIRPLVHEHGGREITPGGSGLLISFSSPRKAVACALAIAKAISARGSRLSDHPLRVRAGVHTGEVTEDAGDPYGDVGDAAASIATKAHDGEVLVSDVVRQLCGMVSDVSFRDRGLLKLRCFPDRSRLHQAVHRVQGTPIGERTPFVGRESERAELRRLIDRAAAGEGGLVMVGGEPGVGKSRLTQEIADESRRRFEVLTGHCYEAQGDLPYMPWVEMMEAALRQTAPETLREAMGEDAPELARLLPELRRVLPDIPPPLELPPDQQRRYAFNSLREYVARMSQARPRLYILEDVHWADEGTLLLLEHLAERLPTIPCLVVATYRDPPVDVSAQLAATLSALVHRRQVRLLVLRRHSAAEVGALLHALSGQPAPEAVRAAIYGETEGNAFFVEEVFRHLVETGTLLDERGRFRDDVGIGELDVPPTVQLVTGQRLARLSETAQRTLSVAAVAGRRVGLDLLEAIAEVKGDELIHALEEAERARLIVTESEGSRENCWFAHELIRQTLVTRIPAARRRRQHLRVADALERLHPDDAGSQSASIAQHLMEAGALADRARLFRHLVVAGRRALASAAFEDAWRQFDRASSLVEAAGPQEVADLLVDLALSLRSLGRFDEALATWSEARAAHEALGDTEGAARVCFEASRDLYWINRDRDAFALVQQGIEALGDRHTPLRVQMLGWSGAAGAWVTPYHVGATSIDEALRLAGELGDDRHRGQVLVNKALHRMAFAHHQETLDAGLEGAALLRGTSDLWEVVTALAFMELAAFELGRLSQASEIGDEVQQLGHRIGHAWALEVVHEPCRWAREFASTPDLARYEEMGRSHLENAGPMGYAHMSYSLLAHAAFLRGDWTDALRLAKEATRHSPPNHSTSGMDWGIYLLTLAYGGSHAGVLSVLDERRDDLPRPGRPNGWGPWVTLLSSIEALDVIGDRRRAAALYPLVRELIATTGAVLSIWQARLVERTAGIAATAGGRWEAAEGHFRAALRQAEELPHRLEQAETRRFYAEMLLERGAPGDAETARGLLDGAIDEYRRIGMPRHEELAQRLRAGPDVTAQPRRSPVAPQYPDSLTAREAEILGLVAAGLTSGELAARLALSVATVQRHIANIYGKIGARNRAEATAYALGHQLAGPADT